MSSDDLYERKTLSLKGRRTTTNQRIDTVKRNMEAKRPLEDWEKTLQEVYEKRQKLGETIQHIEKRLLCGYSEALNESLNQYKKQDMELECQITDILVNR